MFKWTYTILLFQIVFHPLYRICIFQIRLPHFLLLSLILFDLLWLKNFIVKNIWNFSLYFTFLLFITYRVLRLNFNDWQKTKLIQCGPWRLWTLIEKKPWKGRFFTWFWRFVFYVFYLSSIIKSLMYIKWFFTKKIAISSLVDLIFFFFIFLLIFNINALKIFLKFNKLLWSFTIWVCCHLTNLQGFYFLLKDLNLLLPFLFY